MASPPWAAPPRSRSSDTPTRPRTSSVGREPSRVPPFTTPVSSRSFEPAERAGSMPLRCSLLAAAVVLLSACSDDAAQSALRGEDAGDRPLVVPEGLSVSALLGGNGVLDVTALTLLKVATHLEL